MQLLWRVNCTNLPDNYAVAVSHLKGLGRRLQHEPETHVKYSDKIKDMIKLCHAFENINQLETPRDGRLW